MYIHVSEKKEINKFIKSIKKINLQKLGSNHLVSSKLSYQKDVILNYPKNCRFPGRKHVVILKEIAESAKLLFNGTVDPQLTKFF